MDGTLMGDVVRPLKPKIKKETSENRQMRDCRSMYVVDSFPPLQSLLSVSIVSVE